MARKETIYTVDKATNLIVRTSRTLQAAYEYAATQKEGTVFACTSDFQNLKKNDPVANITSHL